MLTQYDIEEVQEHCNYTCMYILYLYCSIPFYVFYCIDTHKDLLVLLASDGGLLGFLELFDLIYFFGCFSFIAGDSITVSEVLSAGS